MRKTSAKKTIPKRLRSKKRKTSGKTVGLFVLALTIFGVMATMYHYRQSLAYYFSFKTDKYSEDERLNALRNFQILSIHGDKSIGFDVSQYQGTINWFSTDSIESAFPLDFVFIRATAGKDVVDSQFQRNWLGAHDHQKLIRGAYHYYRPNENSIEQADNFIKAVKLEKGDLPPVLDIEQIPEEQSIDSLKKGLSRWLKKVERHYKVKPIIYSNESYYNDFLKEEFSQYTFWIANYSFFSEEIDNCWMFWQFTESATIPGITGNVDVNIFNGTKEELRRKTIGWKN
ncbi:MAG TPA: glycoside hydrolase family 25 protein [Flavobacterium sp.]